MSVTKAILNLIQISFKKTINYFLNLRMNYITISPQYINIHLEDVADTFKKVIYIPRFTLLLVISPPLES